MLKNQQIDLSPFVTGILEPGSFPTLDFSGADWPLTAASLLYCEKVLLSHYSSPTQMNKFMDNTERIRTFVKIQETKRSAFEAYRNGLPITQCNFTVDEMILVLSGDYLMELSKRRQMYKPLMQEQVLLWASSSRTLAEVGIHATASDRSITDEMIDEICEWDYDTWFSMNGRSNFLVGARSSAVALGPALMHIRQRLLQSKPAALVENTPERRQFWLCKAFQLELFCHCLITPKNRVDISLNNNVGQALSEVSHFLRQTVHKADVPQPSRIDPSALLAEFFVQMPLVKPRSPEAILELRQKYDAELSEFREHLKNLAFDLGQQYQDSALNISATVSRELVAKFRDLNRRYKAGRKTFWRELAATIGTGVVALTSTFTLNLPMISAVLSILGTGLLIKSVQQLSKEKELVETSGIGFLLRCAETERE
jgi:hypothetical protein